MTALLLALVVGAGAGPAVKFQPPLNQPVVTRTVVTTIATTSGWGTIYSWQRKLWRIGDLWWLFYADGAPSEGGDHVYVTSSDGVTWGDPVVVRNTGSTETSGHRFSTYYDGTYIHYVYGEGNGEGSGGVVFYRRGTPESNSTITWSQAEQTVHSDANSGGAYITVWADSNGAPWVGMVTFTEPAYSAPLIPRVYKSSTTDGTWTTDTGFPQDFASNSTILPPPICVPLDGGRVYCGWSPDTYPDTPFQGRLWDGDSWDAAEDMTTSFGSFTHFGLAPDGTTVHLLFRDGANSLIKYRRRDISEGWGSEVLIDSVVGASFSLAVVEPDKLRLVWQVPSTHLARWARIVGSTVLDIGTLRDESTETMAISNPIQIPYSVTSINAPWVVAYSTDAPTPWNLVTLVVE